MRHLGIDPGVKRVGLAFGDELGVATPLAAVVEADEGRQVERVAVVARERRVQGIVVGYPYNMDGSVGPRARAVDAFISRLEAALPGVVVERVDERLTTQAVHRRVSLKEERRLRASGVLDSAVAAVLLRDYLERTYSLPPALPAEADEP